MSAIAQDGQGRVVDGNAVARICGGWPLSFALVAVAIAQQAIGHFNGDNSWFILFAERVLDGARAYVDIGDPNPPAAFLVYAPAIVAARALGVASEAMVVVEVLLLAFASLAFAGALLRRADLLSQAEIGLWRNAGLWIVLVAPAFGFAEREHFALVLALPMLAVYAARAHGMGVGAGAALAAGVGGGATLCFKPYYAAGFAAAALVAAWRRRSLAPLFGLETVAAGVVVLGYAAFVWRFFPDYIVNALPAAMEVYAPARGGLASLLGAPPFLANGLMLAGAVFALARFGFEARAAVLVAASAGFLFTYVLQGKGWFNHAYPGLALAMFALVALWLYLGRAAPAAGALFARAALAPALICAPFFGAVWMNGPGAEEYPGLSAQMRRLAPARPKIAALAAQLDVAHPLTRRLDGAWIGRQNALWVANCVAQILATQTVETARRARLEDYARRERADFVADIAAGAPDVLLVEIALKGWAARQAEFKDLFAAFDKSGEASGIEIWTRVRPRKTGE